MDNRYTVTAMSAPIDTKTVRVSPEKHAQLMKLAREIDGTADDAIGHLLGESTVRVPISDAQRQRWDYVAEQVGLSLAQFIVMRVEAAIQYGGDPAGLQRIYERVDGIARALELSPRVVRPSTDT